MNPQMRLLKMHENKKKDKWPTRGTRKLRFSAGSNQAFVSMCSSSPHKAHQQPPEMKWHLIQYSHHRQGY